jgi:hypothetical protein
MGLEKYPGDIVTGKRFASGVGSATSTGSFTNDAGTPVTTYKLNVTGLDFIPSVIVLYRQDGFPYVSVNTNAPKVSGYALSNNQGGYRFRVGVGDFKIDNTSFTIPTIPDNSSFNNNIQWVAYE